MMKWIFRLLPLTLLLSCSTVQSQDTTDVLNFVVKRYSFQYAIADSTCTLFRFVLAIPDRENVYLWVDDDRVAEESSYGRIRRYFNQRNGDYTLQDLLTDNLLRNNLPIVGRTYLKQLQGGDRFDITLVCNGQRSCSQQEAEVWLGNHVVVMDKDDVEQIVNINPSKLYRNQVPFIVVDMMDFD